MYNAITMTHGNMYTYTGIYYYLAVILLPFGWIFMYSPLLSGKLIIVQ